MDRREAILSITTALGYTVTPASIITLSNACQAPESTHSWIPDFFRKEDATIIELLGEAMLPETDTPGAIEVGAHLFVDKFLAQVASDSGQERCLQGFDHWKAEFKENFGKAISGVSFQDVETHLSTYFNIGKEEQSTIKNIIENSSPVDQVREKDYYIYSFLMTFKRLIMLGYFASEEIGENVLSYLPVPGSYQGCIPVEEVGNSWAL
jgi:hypothetical protein